MKNVSGRYRDETSGVSERQHVRLHGRIPEDGILRGNGTDSVPARTTTRTVR